MSCTWEYDEHYDYWETGCGNNHVFAAGGVKENGYKYCPYCGKEINAEYHNPADVAALEQMKDILLEARDMMLKHSISAMQEWCDTRGKRALEYINKTIGGREDV